VETRAQLLDSRRGYVRITEKRRLATAAAAIRQRIVNRNRPLVFLPVLPAKKGSGVVAAIIAVMYFADVGYLFNRLYESSTKHCRGSSLGAWPISATHATVASDMLEEKRNSNSLVGISVFKL
jgi:hypothetical protein